MLNIKVVAFAFECSKTFWVWFSLTWVLLVYIPLVRFAPDISCWKNNLLCIHCLLFGQQRIRKHLSWYDRRGAPSISVSSCSSLLSILTELTWFPAWLPDEPPPYCACSLSLACLTHIPSGERFLMGQGDPRLLRGAPHLAEDEHWWWGYGSHFRCSLLVSLQGLCASDPLRRSSFVSSCVIHRWVFAMVATKGCWGGNSSSLLFPFPPALSLKGAVIMGSFQSNINLCSGEKGPGHCAAVWLLGLCKGWCRSGCTGKDEDPFSSSGESHWLPLIVPFIPTLGSRWGAASESRMRSSCPKRSVWKKAAGRNP